MNTESSNPSPTSDDRVTVTIDNGVADVRLVRIEKMNALDRKMLVALTETGEQLLREPGLRAVVLSAAGRAFCAGVDMGSMGEQEGQDGQVSTQLPVETQLLTTRTHGISNIGQHACHIWRLMPVPVIAAVHGVALGGGFQIMMGADMRYAAPATKFSFLEIMWGMVPDMGGTPVLLGSAREDLLRELTYTGRMVDADEALKYGIVTRVCDDPREEALRVAREIAQKNPDAIRAAKRLLNKHRNLSIEESFYQESVEQDLLLNTPNQREAVQASLEKREARFSDPAL